jgi:hypothetical protein
MAPKSKHYGCSLSWFVHHLRTGLGAVKDLLASRYDRILRYMGLIYLLCQYSTALGRTPKFFQLTLAPNLHFSVQYKIDI